MREQVSTLADAEQVVQKARILEVDLRCTDDGGTFVDPGDGPGWANYYRQCQERTDRIISIISDTIASLAEEDANFFLVLAEVHDERNHG